MSTSATPQTPPTGANKADPDTLALRASPRPVTRLNRLNRRMLAVLSGALGIVILGATLWSLQPHKRERNPATELYNVDRVSRADSLDQLPKDYSKVPARQSWKCPHWANHFRASGSGHRACAAQCQYRHGCVQ